MVAVIVWVVDLVEVALVEGVVLVLGDVDRVLVRVDVAVVVALVDRDDDGEVVAVSVADVVRLVDTVVLGELVADVECVLVCELVPVDVAVVDGEVVMVDTMQSLKLLPARNEATASFNAVTMLLHALAGATAIALPYCTVRVAWSPIK